MASAEDDVRRSADVLPRGAKFARGHERPDAKTREAFLSRLARMSKEERVRAARYRFAPWQRQLWVVRYPDEAPLVNGEYEWIALGLADLD